MSSSGFTSYTFMNLKIRKQNEKRFEVTPKPLLLIHFVSV